MLSTCKMSAHVENVLDRHVATPAHVVIFDYMGMPCIDFIVPMILLPVRAEFVNDFIQGLFARLRLRLTGVPVNILSVRGRSQVLFQLCRGPKLFAARIAPVNESIYPFYVRAF